jgi:hypothetical protein
MEFRNPFKSDIKHFISKEAENALYEKAANDMDKNIIDKGIWTKAFAKAEGDKLKQKAFYIELIVEHYKDLIRAGEELATILATEEEKRYKQEVKIQQELKRQQEEINRKKKEEKRHPEYDEQSDNAGFIIFAALFVCCLILIAIVGNI